MKSLILAFSILASSALWVGSALASDLMVAAAMQRCTTNEECTLITNSCTDNCGFVPVNKLNMEILGAQYQNRCGKAMTDNPQCNMNPPIAAACINARCTIDYAYANHAAAADYKSGAFPTAESPVANAVPNDFKTINDRDGRFTAYDLPSESVRQNMLGQIVTPGMTAQQAPTVAAPVQPQIMQPEQIAPAAAPPQMAPQAQPMANEPPPGTPILQQTAPGIVAPRTPDEAMTAPQPVDNAVIEMRMQDTGNLDPAAMQAQPQDMGQLMMEPPAAPAMDSAQTPANSRTATQGTATKSFSAKKPKNNGFQTN